MSRLCFHCSFLEYLGEYFKHRKDNAKKSIGNHLFSAYQAAAMPNPEDQKAYAKFIKDIVPAVRDMVPALMHNLPEKDLGELDNQLKAFEKTTHDEMEKRSGKCNINSIFCLKTSNSNSFIYFDYVIRF